jgi:hypothetical protein
LLETLFSKSFWNLGNQLRLSAPPAFGAEAKANQVKRKALETGKTQANDHHHGDLSRADFSGIVRQKKP